MAKQFRAQKPIRKSREVMVGSVGIGGDNPIRVQTMINVDSLNTKATIAQIKKCADAGAELIRIAIPTVRHAENLKEIKDKLKAGKVNTPLIADVHFLPKVAEIALKYADKVRLNPGNFLDYKNFKEYSPKIYQEELEKNHQKITPFILQAKKYNKPLRIGANHGSLSSRILTRFGDTPEGLVESVMEYLRIFCQHSFFNLVVSLKSSNPLVMIEANRLLAAQMQKEKMNFPLHLGVTESGSGEEGRVKSIIGISALLLDGLGDTIRVSLTEAPEREIPVCYNILQASGRRITKTEFISCPSCGRTQYNIEKVAAKIKKQFSGLKGVKIAIMGCAVNGPGEMAGADFGYVGGAQGKVNLYYRQNLVKANISESLALSELENLIKSKTKII